MDGFARRKCQYESEQCSDGKRIGPVESDFEPIELCTSNCVVMNNKLVAADPDVNFTVKNCKLY